jgi:hypothetical protein
MISNNQLSQLQVGSKITRIEIYKQNNKYTRGYLKSISINRSRIYVCIDNVVGELSPQTISCYTSFNNNILVFNSNLHLEKVLQKSKDYFIELGILRHISSYMYVHTIVFC